MVRLVDDALRTRFDRAVGVGADDVVVVDPAVGTGMFLLALLRSIVETIKADQGEGAVGGMIEQALPRLVGFEAQLGPFVVAQLRLLAELADLHADVTSDMKLYVTGTLGNPYATDENLKCHFWFGRPTPKMGISRVRSPSAPQPKSPGQTPGQGIRRF